MSNLTPIIAATDFSSNANRAMVRAALIARQQGAALHLLHVATPLALYPGQDHDTADGNPVSSSLIKQIEATTRMLRERCAIPVLAAWRIGRAHRQIADYAAEVGANLVVVGARGRSTLARLLLGSTAWRLPRVCRCPVLIVRCEPDTPYGRVLAGVDLFPHSVALVEWARRLSANRNPLVLHALEPIDESVLRANSMDDAALHQWREKRRAIASRLMAKVCASVSDGEIGRIESQIEPGYPSNRILESAADWHAELIVLGYQGRGGFDDFLMGSVSKDVAQEADCDVLLVRG